MKFVQVSIMVLLLAVLTSATVYAQGKGGEAVQELGLCVPDCPSDVFIGPDTVTFNVGSCTFRVDYWYRKACGQYCDIQIRQVSSMSTNPACAAINPKTLLDAAITATIVHALANHNPPLDCGPTQNNECSSYWRVSRSACWKVLTGSQASPFGVVYGPCSSDACCFSVVQVCKSQYGQIVITQISQSATACPSGSEFNNCSPVCD